MTSGISNGRLGNGALELSTSIASCIEGLKL